MAISNWRRWVEETFAGSAAVSTRRKQGQAFGWTLAGTLVTQLGTYLTIVLLTRTLGIEDYGRLATIQATLAGAFGVANLGTGITATRFVLRYLRDDPDRAGRILGLSASLAWLSGLLITAGIWSQSDWIASQIFRRPDLSDPLRWSSVGCLLLTVNANLTGALLGFQAFGGLMRVQLIHSLGSIMFTILLVRSLAFHGAVLALPLNAAFGWMILNWAARTQCRSHQVRVTYWKAWSERNILQEFALPAAASGMVASVSVWSAQMLLLRSEMGVTDMGAWTAAQGMRAMVLFAPGILTRISGPILAELHDQNNTEGYRQALWNTALLASASTLVVGGILWAVSSWLVLVLGNDFSAARSILPLTFLSATFESFASSVSISLLADGKLRRQVFVMAGWGITLVLTAHLTVPWFGPNGLAFAYVCSWLFTCVAYTRIAKGLLKSHAGSCAQASQSSVFRLISQKS